MSGNDKLTAWRRWVQQPQKIWLRRALFQVHLWTGIALGLYVFVISITGSVLVYWNELYLAATPAPVISKASGPLLTDQQLKAAALRLYPAYRVMRIARARNPEQAVDVHLERGQELQERLFDPHSGADLGNSVPFAMHVVNFILDLHDNLLAGQTGRVINGIIAFIVLAMVLSGIVIWWPGSRTWRRSLTLPRRLGWKAFNWHLHSMIGFWTFAFTVIFCLSGIYLCFPDRVQDIADWIQPLTTDNVRVRLVDRVVYWLAYLHFGRINGIGIPCHGPGLCDQTTKAAWAFFGLAPAAMFVTGAIMWWNRVLRPKFNGARRSSESVNA